MDIYKLVNTILSWHFQLDKNMCILKKINKIKCFVFRDKQSPLTNLKLSIFTPKATKYKNLIMKCFCYVFFSKSVRKL